METWTHMEDMHGPVAPGSYKFGTGHTRLNTKQDTKVNLVCIRSAVKAPLLSDLSHRAKIRYGLDVVMQREQPPMEYIHHEHYVPPPTAEAISTGKHLRSPFPKHGFETERRTVNFKKLQPYKWTPMANMVRGVKKAPDLLYRNTFGENNQANSNLLSPRPDVRSFGESPRSPSPVRTPGRNLTSQSSSARLAPPSRLGSPPKGVTRLASPPKGVLRPASEGSRPPTRQPRQLSGKRLLKSLSDMDELRPNVKPLSAASNVDQRQGLAGSSGCLFSQVQQSIQFVQRIENGQPIEVPRLVRPLLSECGRYRPHSRTSIETPRMQSPVHAYRDHKSADAYLKIIAASKEADTSAVKRTRSYTSMGSPAMTEIINQYMTSHERYNTPTSALQHVTDVNRPHSRASTRQSVRFEMPAWARAETRQTTDNESEYDAASRVQSRAEKAIDVPAVHISYADKKDSEHEAQEHIQDNQQKNVAT